MNTREVDKILTDAAKELGLMESKRKSRRRKLKENKRGKIYKPSDWNAKELLLSMLEEEDYWTWDDMINKFYDWYEGTSNLVTPEDLYSPDEQPYEFCKKVIDRMTPQEAYRFCKEYDLTRFLEPNFDPDKPYNMEYFDGMESYKRRKLKENVDGYTREMSAIMLNTKENINNTITYIKQNIDEFFNDKYSLGVISEVENKLKDIIRYINEYE